MLKNAILAIVALFVVVGFIYFGTKPNIAKAPSRISSPAPSSGTSSSTSVLSLSEAKAIAEKTCIKGGEAIKTDGYYNDNSKTWWFDANLNATKPGCNPACVVSEITKTAEINWRCTGLKQ